MKLQILKFEHFIRWTNNFCCRTDGLIVINIACVPATQKSTSLLRRLGMFPPVSPWLPSSELGAPGTQAGRHFRHFQDDTRSLRPQTMIRASLDP